MVRQTGRSVKPSVLSNDADHDLDLILAYLETIPKKPARMIVTSILKALRDIGDFPYRGALQSDLTRIAGVEVRSQLVHSYRIFYTVGGDAPRIVGVLHTSRDILGTIARRLP